MKYFLLILLSSLLVACATGRCANQVKSNDTSGVVSATSAADPSVIRVSKEDGSLQCDKGKGIALATMENQLKKAGIKVISSKKQPDNLMRVQMCGAPTGMSNTFEISKADLAKAEKLGFKRWQD